VSVDSAGNIYVTGFTNSPTLPVTEGALSSTSAGSLEGLLLVVSPDLKTRRYLNPFPATGSNDKKLDGTHGAFFRLLEP